MDELLEGVNENEHLKFIVSLDNNEINPMLYNCTEWGDLYSEYGDFGNDPMILNGDEDLDGQINILDIVQLANMILSNDYQESADLNSDGSLNILDIVQLVNIILDG